MTRKIVQISTYASNDSFFVYALCDDGTLWCSIRGGDVVCLNPKDDFWGLVANVPQHKRYDEDLDELTKADKIFKDHNY